MSGTTQATDTQTPVGTTEDTKDVPVVAICVAVVGLLLIIGIAILLVIRRRKKNQEVKEAPEDMVTERRDSLLELDDNLGLTIQERVQNMEAENAAQGLDNSGFYKMKDERTSVVRTPSEVVVPKKAIFKRNAYSTENIAVESSNFGSRAATKEDITFMY